MRYLLLFRLLQAFVVAMFIRDDHARFVGFTDLLCGRLCNRCRGRDSDSSLKTKKTANQERLERDLRNYNGEELDMDGDSLGAWRQT